IPSLTSCNDTELTLRVSFRPQPEPTPDTASADQSEQVIRHLKQEIEHLNTLLLSKDSHIDSLKQAMLLLENHQAKLTESPAPWWKFWKKS
ncbi:hypothetical protein LQG23_28370, partial [Klebsiella quasipneumoniae]|nr:hypothetical protein [Klebsiella quasipneumoniae]